MRARLIIVDNFCHTFMLSSSYKLYLEKGFGYMLHSKLFLRGILTFFVLISANIHSTIATPEIKEKVKNTTDQYISDKFFNAVYAFSDGQDTFCRGANGLYSVEDGTLLVANQQMPVASVTKSMTAAGILKLRDKKLLDVNDTLDKHLSSSSNIWNDNKLPEWANKVSIHNLLTHTSGLSEYFMAMELNVNQPIEAVAKDIANYASKQELRFEPGSKHEYINTNYVLLGLIIEQVSGKSLDQFYRDEIFTPLEMKDTRLAGLEEAVKGQQDQSSSGVPIRYFVVPTGDKPQFNEAKASFIMVPYADGGVISTADDILKWHEALHSGKVISEESLALMKTKHYEITDKTGKNNYIGYGLFIAELDNGDTAYHHAGSALAIRCESGFIPNKGLYYAVLSNVMNYIPDEMKDKIDLSNPKNQLDIHYFTQSIFNSI